MLLLGVPSCPRASLVRRLAARKGVGGSSHEGGLRRLVVSVVYLLDC